MRSFVGVLLIAFKGSVAAADAQDPAVGRGVFAGRCKTCHQIGESARNAIGPVLNGIVGRRAGAYPDYSYSSANKDSGITWDEANLAVYLAGPKGLVPGTKKSFAGLRSAEDIADVIAYLKEFGPDGRKN